jgi:ribosomal protein S18 acetylase RimI-like enzyme
MPMVVDEARDATQAGSASRDVGDEPAWDKLTGWTEHADEALNLKNWLLAYRDGKLAGAVFAQRYFDKPEEGSIFFIGLTPEFRGKGLAKILHAKGLELLSNEGCTGYVGSTDIQNTAMIAVFKANDCTLTTIRKIDTDRGIVLQ